ncbi:MAG: polyamine aminopropyltransferase [Burkholderiaceae bacterium]|nr:polyamine aminopropyltransferase [Burkholderiaceae bacterium]
MQGLHLTADLYGCKCSPSLLTDAQALAALCTRAVDQSQLTVVDQKFFTFPHYEGQPGGVTGAVLLAESHLALHTWPERSGVTLDVYVCNFSTDNSAKAERLMDDLLIAFAPSDQTTNRILRGSAEPGTSSDELLLEWLNADSAFGYRASRRIETVRSPFQTVEVFDTPQFGKLFRIDGYYMSSEKDEFFYHEPIVHCAAIAHPGPRSALVIGGGDGGSSEELLKHATIERVVMAELDPEVVRIARRYLGEVHRQAFDDPRLEVHIGDGFEFTARSAERFDLIVLDLTDPDTPARRMYTPEFFRMARGALNPGGAISLHIGSPVFQPGRVRDLLAALRTVFPIVRPLGQYIPLYGSYWGMAVASDALDPRTIDADTVEQRLRERGVDRLQLYNGEIHCALFALSNFYRALLD